ncbi:MAG: prolyl-tRNA synthetase associated domain-containing protein [Alphaproteobacteria bacterium]|nr:prolyl-tRNA synthetase associated domain-containing protein [Alphaproteobacteria bacterium]
MPQSTAKQDAEPPLPTTPDDLFACLHALDISYSLYHHEPFFTVEEGRDFEKDIPGTHCRNLFLKDKKDSMFLLTLANETAVDLKQLPALFGAKRLSFGSPERLWRHLGIRPGSVCPFTIMNDATHAVDMILDAAMMRADLVNFHPLDNSMTVGMTPADLLRFIESRGRSARVLDFSLAG